MLFLGPFYNWINSTSLSQVNHFPLVRLIIFSLDKTILYLLVFAVLRCLWLVRHHRRTTFGRELKLGLFVGWGFGELLHEYIITVVPPNNVMFNPALSAPTFIIPTIVINIITVALGFFVNYSLKRVNMLEALQSVD